MLYAYDIFESLSPFSGAHSRVAECLDGCMHLFLSDEAVVSGTCMKYACLQLYIETSSQQTSYLMKSSILTCQTVV